MNIVKNNNTLSTLINLQNNTDVISRYGCNGNTYVHCVDPIFVHKFTRLSIDCIDIHFMNILFHLIISSELWSSGYNGGLVIWRPNIQCNSSVPIVVQKQY